MANAIRALTMDAVQQANSGHPGAPMGMADMAVALWGRHLRHNPGDLFRIPTFLVINTLMLMPIRLLGFVRMAHNAGWGTRAGGFSGGQERTWRSSIPLVIAATLVAGALLVQR